MSWATAANALTYTGATVTEDQVEQSQAMVEIIAGVVQDDSNPINLSLTDQRLLKLAVSYQAAWITAHPGVFQNMDLSSVSQDGISGNLASAHAGLLAPMTIRCINRLSWKRAPLRARLDRRRQQQYGNRDSAVRDDNSRSWRSL